MSGNSNQQTVLELREMIFETGQTRRVSNYEKAIAVASVEGLARGRNKSFRWACGVVAPVHGVESQTVESWLYEARAGMI